MFQMKFQECWRFTKQSNQHPSKSMSHVVRPLLLKNQKLCLHDNDQQLTMAGSKKRKVGKVALMVRLLLLVCLLLLLLVFFYENNRTYFVSTTTLHLTTCICIVFVWLTSALAFLFGWWCMIKQKAVFRNDGWVFVVPLVFTVMVLLNANHLLLASFNEQETMMLLRHNVMVSL
jgi:hypothetical protein